MGDISPEKVAERSPPKDTSFASVSNGGSATRRTPGSQQLSRRPIHTIQVGSSPVDRYAKMMALHTPTISLTRPREFGGAIGVSVLFILLPLLVIVLVDLNRLPNPTMTKCYNELNKLVNSTQAIAKIRTIATGGHWIQAVGVVIGWTFMHALLYRLPIGPIVVGQTLYASDSRRLEYKMNGVLSLLVTTVILFTLHYVYAFPFARYLNDQWLTLCIVSCAWSFVLAVALYVHAVVTSSADDEYTGVITVLCDSCIIGNILYDFWSGRCAHARPFGVDMKLVLRRAGALAWYAFNVAMLFDYLTSSSARNEHNWSLLFLITAQCIYIIDSIFNEHLALCQFQIEHDGTGFMTVFGTLVFTPFVFTLATAYARRHGVRALPHPVCLLVPVVLFAIGWYMERASNTQKYRLRLDSNHASVRDLKSNSTSVVGRRLLADGWWSVCRHPNYAGTLLQTIAYSAAVGVAPALVPHAHAFYALPFLLHRVARVERHMLRQYASAWFDYYDHVPYQLIPGIY